MKLGRETAEVILTSADISSALQSFTNEGISVSRVNHVDELRLRFSVPGRDFKRLCVLAANRGDTVELKRRSGIESTLKSIRKRPVLLLGLTAIFCLSCWLPTRVYFVRVEGNERIPAKQILQQAELCGIAFGADRRQVRSEKVKNQMLSGIKQLQWAGINTVGCTAVITVRERKDQNEKENNSPISSIVAARDGIIREMTVLLGNPLCHVGQAVKAGQTLVSPYTDCGICIRVTGAKGEIYGQTQRQLSVIYPSVYQQRTEKKTNTKKYSLIIGKKRINFFKGSGISGGSCAKIYEEKYVSLPGGFVLPIGIAVETWTEYDMTSELAGNAQSLLPRFTAQYLQEIMHGGKILDSAFVFSQGDAFTRMDGVFDCYEMIGLLRQEDMEKYE